MLYQLRTEENSGEGMPIVQKIKIIKMRMIKENDQRTLIRIIVIWKKERINREEAKLKP